MDAEPFSEGGRPLARTLAALAPVAPEAAARATAALGLCLEGVRRSIWPEVAWRFSRLQPGGFPVELGFSTAGESITYTAEVAGPEAAEATRLDAALRLLDALGAGVPPAATVARLRGLQAAGRLRWGAWLGGRHGGDDDRFKLYAEAPEGGDPTDFIRRSLGGLSLAGIAVQGPFLHMAGSEPGGRSELYFRFDGFAPGGLRRLLALAGLGEREGELRAVLDAAWEAPAEAALARAVGWFSLSLPPDGGPPDRLSLFKRAVTVLGPGRGGRRRLLALAGGSGGGSGGGGLAAYRRITRDLETCDGRGAHGSLSFVVSPGRPVELRIGIDPSAIIHEDPRGELI